MGKVVVTTSAAVLNEIFIEAADASGPGRLVTCLFLTH